MSNLDRSLDDVIRSRSNTRGGRGGRGGNRGGYRSSNSNSNSGPVRNDRRSNQNRRNTPYSRGTSSVASVPVALPFNVSSQLLPLTAASTSSNIDGKWQHDLYAQQNPQETAQVVGGEKVQGDTVHISGLPQNFDERDLSEIFGSVGAIKSGNINYNSQGESQCTATVQFVNRRDAAKAVEEYDQASIDSATIKVKLVADVVTAPVVVKKSKPQVQQQQMNMQMQPQLQLVSADQLAQFQSLTTLQSYPAQNQQRSSRPVVRSRRPPSSNQQQQRGGNQRNQNQSRGGNQQQQRGGNQQRGGRGSGQSNRSNKQTSQTDLDKELDSYLQQNQNIKQLALQPDA